MKMLKTISLFSGAGGLDLGLEVAGFSILCCVEIDSDARSTLKSNRPTWILAEPNNIFELPPKELLTQAGVSSGETDLLVGGPPCQPFSVSSHWVNGGPIGLGDPRSNTIKCYLKVVEEALPKTILLENVLGFSRSLGGNGSAIDFIQYELSKINKKKHTNYKAFPLKIDVSNYGVPQHRLRYFVLASREGLPFEMPLPRFGLEIGLQPYRTAWDAIGELDEAKDLEILTPHGKWAELLPSIPEGKNYLWHTSRGGGLSLFGWRTKYWSFLLKLAKNKPSWTIQASPGPASGPFHWKNRLLSIDELLRIQTFPLNYSISGSYKIALKQIGNAVPSAMGELLGFEIRRQFFGHQVDSSELSLIPKPNRSCPPPEKIEAVPEKYFSLNGVHPDHPGTGKGPGRVHKV